MAVKICGITSLRDALQAVDAGADALGFMFHPASRRYVEPSLAAQIVPQLPDHILSVGVFVNAETSRIRELVDFCSLNAIQLHGEESPDFCSQFSNLTVLKAFRVKDRSSLESLPVYAHCWWLLDRFVPNEPVGTVQAFDWSLAAGAKLLGGKIFLAGGLTPENVGHAIAQVEPAGVDVSSGVELSPGVKDPQRVKAFIRAVKGPGQ